MRRIFICMRNTWIIMGITLLMLVLLEAGFSIYYHFHRNKDTRAIADCYAGADWVSKYYEEFNDCIVHWTWKPYVYWKREPYSGIFININQEGLRNTIFETGGNDKANKKVRIFMFGGSTIWGTGARDEFTIPSLVGSELSKRGLNVEVLNFGELGYVNTQELIRLYLEFRRKNLPDLVVFYDGANDMFSAYQQRLAGNPQNESNRVNEFNATKGGRKKSMKLFLDSLMTFSFARFVTGFIDRKIKINNYTEQETDKLASETVDIYFENVNLISYLEGKYGFKTLFYWQPIIFNKLNLSQYEQKEAEKVDYQRQFVTAVRDKIRENQLSEKSAKVHDISDIFEDLRKPVFLDLCHISEYGNSVVANRIAKDIYDALK
jgi:lysophospholipase L1-like esterase